MTDSASVLPRRIGLWTSAAVVVGITIGVGIFRVPSTVAAQVGSAPLIMLAWLTGGVITLCLALSFAELSTMFPHSGGTYVYLREAYGRQVAFLYGWTFVFVSPAAWAALALIFTEYLAHFVPLSGNMQRILALGLIGAIVTANYRSVPIAALVQNLSTAAKIATLLGLVALIFLFGQSADGAAMSPTAPAASGVTLFGVAMISVLFAYEGATTFCALSGEVLSPGRTLPRALILGVSTVLLLYLSVNAAYLHVLSVETLALSSFVATDAILRVTGPVGASIVAALVMLSVFGCLVALVLADTRIPFAMSQDGLFFRQIGRVHERFNTPHLSVLITGSVAALYVTIRTFDELLAIFVLGLWPFYALAAAGVIVLRYRRPDVVRPYRVPLYPLLPIVIVAATFLMLVSSLIAQPGVTFVNVAVVLTGIAVYMVWRYFNSKGTGTVQS